MTGVQTCALPIFPKGLDFSTEGLRFDTTDGLHWPGGNVKFSYAEADQGHLHRARHLEGHGTAGPVHREVEADGDDTVLVICTLDPKSTRTTVVHLDMPKLGFEWHEVVYGHDLVTDTTWTWAKDVTIHIDPFRAVAHIVTLRRMP